MTVISGRWKAARLAKAEAELPTPGPLPFPRAIVAAASLDLAGKQLALGEAMQELAEVERYRIELQGKVDGLSQEIADYVRLLDRMREENSNTEGDST